MVRNSGEVAIKLIDKARSLGLPCKMECSTVAHSDSRYVILFPRHAARGGHPHQLAQAPAGSGVCPLHRRQAIGDGG